MPWLLSLLTPMLLHMFMQQLSLILSGGRLDATACTAVAAVLTIIPAALMYRRDRLSGFAAGTEAKPKTAARPDGGYSWKKCNDQKERERRTGRNRQEALTMHSIRFAVLCFVAGGILNLAWSGILNMLHINEVFSNEVQEQLLAGQIAVQLVGLGLLVPVAEELIFRALIYNRMKRVLTVRQAIFFSALLFAVYHGNPVQMIFAFPMALALAWVYEHGKLFLFPVLFHTGANLTAVLMNFF